ncbi:MAG: hypothetical protein A2Y14_03415 [Verrucomicrobia bacterium GWF2_51_19]|nr:MAG: hypothetical protein A2Y14_03415 [Verrucomicrobia bacterium GWF2_51_19]HCJ11491.1 acetyl-CoA carboxylase biotin carboxyl carrier protein subunit [Opitutae bacterium]
MQKHLKVSVDGQTFDVVVECSETTHVASSPSPVAPSAPVVVASTPAYTLKSPLAGKVVSIDVAIGQSIAKGQKVLTLEAMKMNTVISATENGTVRSILVIAGQAIEEGQPLMAL